MLEKIISLIQKSRSKNIAVVYDQHCGNEKSPFKKGSVGWNIYPSICPAENDCAIEKKHSDSFQGTNLEQVLKQLSINQIVVCGLVTEGCVDTTIRRTYRIGYQIELVNDCHSTTDSNA